MTTSVIVGVLGLGAVGMSSAVQDTRMTAALNQLMGDLNLSRSEAIKRGSSATLCASTSGRKCLESRAWTGGWILFADVNGNGQLDPGDQILRRQEITQFKSLHFSAWGPGTGRWVTYEADGTTKQNGTFTFCDDRGANRAKAVILLGTGRPRISAVSSSGDPLTCS